MHVPVCIGYIGYIGRSVATSATLVTLEVGERLEVSSEDYFGGISSFLIMILSFLVCRLIRVFQIDWCNRHRSRVDIR